MLQTGQSNIITDNWHHVAFSFDSSSSNLQLFVDGILKNSSNVSIDTSSIQLSNIVLGSNIDASIDNVKIFNTALDTEQIQYLAASGNYNNTLQNNIVDLKFNDNYHTPAFDDVHVSSIGDVGYSNGFIQGSKAIDLNNGYIQVNDDDGFATDELSFSAWVNLTALSVTQHIAVSDGFDMFLNTSNISLSLGGVDVTFTNTNDDVPFFTGERLKIDFNSGVNDTSYDAKTNNVGVVSTDVAGGVFNNDILSYPNASFYADKITLSSWVKTDTGGTIFNINDNLNVNVNSSGFDVEVGVSAQSKVLVSQLNSTHYTVINKITSFDGEALGSLIQSSGNVEFDIVFDSLKKFQVSEISFNVPFRNHSPTNISVFGIDSGSSVELINEGIAFRNKQYTYKVYNTSDVPFNTIKVRVIGGGDKLRIKDIKFGGYLYSYIVAYTGQDDVSAIVTGGDVLSFDPYNTLTIHLNAGISVGAILYNITGNSLTDLGQISNGFTIIIDDIGDYFVRLTDTNGIVYDSNKIVAAVYAPSPFNVQIAFHHGIFDNVHGDETINNAANNGHIYSDTVSKTYTWGSLDSVLTTSTNTTYKWTPSDNITVSALVVAGGGGGGYDMGGGGGAGGFLEVAAISLNGQSTIIVGNGGNGSTGALAGSNFNGHNSSINSVVALGGGGGASVHSTSIKYPGGNGGSGGGGSGGSGSGSARGQGTIGQGFDGADAGRHWYPGGGGGAGEMGYGKDGTNSSNTTVGHGGDGKPYTIKGVDYWFSGGGGASGYTTTGGNGGKGGGGGGAVGTTYGGVGGITVGSPGGGGTINSQTNRPGGNAGKHTGGGGGGGSHFNSNNNGGNGGSGIVVVSPHASLTFDANNKLTIENPPPEIRSVLLKFTPIGSSNEQSYDIGIATEITIAKGGSYRVEIKSSGSYIFSNSVTVTSILTKQQLSINGSNQPMMTLSDIGDVYVWGENYNAGNASIRNTLGLNTTTTYYTKPTLNRFFSDKDIVHVRTHVGAVHGLAVTKSGQVYSWGYNASGQLGYGNTTTANSANPALVTGLTSVHIVSVAVGNNESHALDSTGNVWSWGMNGKGQLGLNDVTNRSTPVKVPTFESLTITQIDAGHDFLIALDSTGNAWTCGRGDYESGSPIGHGGSTDIKIPTKLTTFSNNVIKVFAGYFFGAVITNDNKVFTWGQNQAGQLGNGTTTATRSPGEITYFTTNNITVMDMALGPYHSLALTDDGKVYAWGSNDQGQIGNGLTTNVNTPVLINSLSNIISLGAGYSRSFAIDESGVAYAWGANNSGTLGIGSTTPTNVIVPTSLGINLKSTHLSFDGYNKLTIHNPPSGLENVVFYHKATGSEVETSADIGTATNIYINDLDGEYRAAIKVSSSFVFTNSVTIPKATTTELYTWAFHHGNFDNAYGDGDVLTARDNGRFYADTPSYTGEIGTIECVADETNKKLYTTYTFTPSQTLTADVLMVAGGAGGAGRYNCGGGGAGGLVYEENRSISGTKTIIVGNGNMGGVGGGQSGFDGSSTSITGLTIAVGGGGGSNQNGNGRVGGSGGGGGGGEEVNAYDMGGTGGAGTTNQGNKGGGLGSRLAQHGGGGGGGAGGIGLSGAYSKGGSGGIGKYYGDIFGEEYGEGGWFAGGGGGGIRSFQNGGLYGLGGGGHGSTSSGYLAYNAGDIHALPHTGGGGGGGGTVDRDNHPFAGLEGRGGNGGSGIVLLRTNISIPNTIHSHQQKPVNPRKRQIPLITDGFSSPINRWYIVDRELYNSPNFATHWFMSPAVAGQCFTTQGTYTSQTRADGGTSTVYTVTGSGGYFGLDSNLKNTQTVESVFYPKSQQRYNILLSIGNNTTNDIQLDMMADGTASLYRNNSATLISKGTHKVFTANKWHHIALTVDANGNAIGYVNGHKVVTGTFATVSAIGSRTGNILFRCGANSVTFYQFMIYYANLYNSLLSPSQISDIAQSHGFGFKMSFDGINKLTISNNIIGATLYHTAICSDIENSIDIGTANEVYTIYPGTYRAMLRGESSHLFTNEITLNTVDTSFSTHFFVFNSTILIRNMDNIVETTLYHRPSGSEIEKYANIGTATNIYIAEVGGYRAEIKSDNIYVFTDTIVIDTPSAITYTSPIPTLEFLANKLSILDAPYGITGVTLLYKAIGSDIETSTEVGTTTVIYINQPGTYQVMIKTVDEFYYTNKLQISSGSITFPNFQAVFHYGKFDNKYNDGDVFKAAANGHMYADTHLGVYVFGKINKLTSDFSQTKYDITLNTSFTGDALVVAGGGAGGHTRSGGGGAGGLVYKNNISITETNITVIVGNGGLGGGGDGLVTTLGTHGQKGTSTNIGLSGKNSFLTGVDEAYGGGGGGNEAKGRVGGSSSGCGGRFKGTAEAPYPSGQGNLGGDGQGTDSFTGAGGGGAGGKGGNQSSGAGGAGINYSTVFTSKYGDNGWFAGGGGGARNSGSSSGGSGGGGQGSYYGTFLEVARQGKSHTGGGGGGVHYHLVQSNYGGNGGSGIVILKKT